MLAKIYEKSSLTSQSPHDHRRQIRTGFQTRIRYILFSYASTCMRDNVIIMWYYQLYKHNTFSGWLDKWLNILKVNITLASHKYHILWMTGVAVINWVASTQASLKTEIWTPIFLWTHFKMVLLDLCWKNSLKES